MLKALELFGFKSFADKTRFEFPQGITVIVGPNGSGKSNVVDAIKWVLGEQSAKSLRGQEMADVIFKGSGGGRRKPANTAEATIVFDNTDRLLQLDDLEVHVTRRVYRSGEGEYLINGQACRLRDVRDLFRGTGLGTDAYSIIEQGKVDMLLQASPRDRRAIFEEAAGISRFKAKKVETQRRLARVEQNLVRLADLVEEVETRLKNVRAQAAKARRYQQYTERLKELRTETSQSDWRRLTSQYDARQEERARLQAACAETLQALTGRQEELESLDQQAQASSQLLHDGTTRLARVQERLAAARQSQSRELQQMAQLDQQREQLQQQWCNAHRRLRELAVQQETLRGQLDEARGHWQAMAEELKRHQAEVARWKADREQLEGHLHQRRQELQRQMRASMEQGSRLGSLDNQRATLEQRIEQDEIRQAQWERQIRDAGEQLVELEAEEQRLAELAARTSAAVDQTRRQLTETQTRIDRLRDEQTEIRTQWTAAQERLSLLAELEQRQEGIGVGVKDVLARAADQVGPPFGEVVGMVADVVQVQVDLAPLLDVALGAKAQYVVLRGTSLLAAIESGSYRPPGRVGLVPLERAEEAPAEDPPEWAADRAVIGRADRFARTDPRYSGLVTHLLGTTWLVETLADARRLHAAAGTVGWQWVTRAGEMVRADGTVIAGPRQSGIGIVSRRSQIAELRRQIERLERNVAQVGEDLKRRSGELEELQQHLVGLGKQQDQATTDYAQQMIRVQGVRQRRDDWIASRDALGQELESRRRQHEQVREEADQVRRELADRQQEIAELEAGLQRGARELEQLQQAYRGAVDAATAAQVRAATSQQQLESLDRQCQQAAQQRGEREQEGEQIGRQLAHLSQQRDACQLQALQAGGQWALLALEQQELAEHLARQQATDRRLQEQRAAIARQVHELREQLHEQEAQCHQCERAVERLELERDNLAQRVREDFGLELAELDARLGDRPAQERQEVDEEIAQLRRKIANIGAVNMEALDELDELEQRFGGMHAQYQDLVQAKEALERIIERINRDSRRLFSETLEKIRQNFQQLFRRVFGGGTADIVLEEGIDILEAGVEIVATPPGKHSLSITLLSGGEKALTAVTLLLAIFQYRPSPFCVLDEVDGPLDEANIGRFLEVLREFLQWTRFVIVTHSKKTMTAASTLYGVTMQESGVSKRVSVQFDDVSEDGQIRRQALAREAGAGPEPEVA